MRLNFFDVQCQDRSEEKLFGLCDDRPGQRAYIDESDGRKWIAVVVNDYKHDVLFTAVDHCIDTYREDGNMDKRCDGFLTYGKSVTFVELKESDDKGNKWILNAEEQLRTSINYFEDEDVALNYTVKKAYIANNEHPKFRVSQSRRMNQFFEDTGYVLRIENRIILDS